MTILRDMDGAGVNQRTFSERLKVVLIELAARPQAGLVGYTLSMAPIIREWNYGNKLQSMVSFFDIDDERIHSALRGNPVDNQFGGGSLATLYRRQNG